MLDCVIGLAWSGAGVRHTSWSLATVNAVSAVGAFAIGAWVAYLAERRHRELQRQRAAKVVPFVPRCGAGRWRLEHPAGRVAGRLEG